MPLYNLKSLNTQNDLLLQNLMVFYKETSNINKFMKTVNGDTNISLRIIDWFVTNYAKKYYTIYEIKKLGSVRFKVYNDYKLKLKAYSKKRFDPFCRWKRIQIPYNDTQNIETTIGQLNFFKWAIENDIIEYIHEHYSEIESDMNARNTVSKKRNYTERSTSSMSSTEDEISDEQKLVRGLQGTLAPALLTQEVADVPCSLLTTNLGGSAKQLETRKAGFGDLRSPDKFGHPKSLDNLIDEPDAQKARDVVNDIKPLDTNNKTRKRREELSISACKCIKKETVKILVKFS